MKNPPHKILIEPIPREELYDDIPVGDQSSQHQRLHNVVTLSLSSKSFMSIIDMLGENFVAKKVQLKTSKNSVSPAAFLNSIEDKKLRKDCKSLMKIFKETTGMKPKMWGPSIIGFGEYTYYRSNGDEGQFMACGFSPRKSGPTLYIMPGYQNYNSLLKKLGPHKLGKSCLYLKSLENINLEVISKLIKMGLKDLKKKHETNY